VQRCRDFARSSVTTPRAPTKLSRVCPFAQVLDMRGWEGHKMMKYDE
jgi:hypothetical protein